MIANTLNKISSFASNCKVSIGESINQSFTESKKYLKFCEKMLNIIRYIFASKKRKRRKFLPSLLKRGYSFWRQNSDVYYSLCLLSNRCS